MAVSRPAGESVVGNVPVYVVQGQIAPECAGEEDTEHGVAEAAVVLWGGVSLCRGCREGVRDGFPGAVGDIVSAVGGGFGRLG